MKTKSLHYSKGGRVNEIAAEIGRVHACVCDQLPPAYPCEGERVVFVGVVKGTSLAAPAWAAILAGIRQRKGEVEPEDLYRVAGGNRYLEPQPYFTDIVQGETRLNQAQKGWDLCTGLGSPRVSRLLAGLEEAASRR